MRNIGKKEIFAFLNFLLSGISGMISAIHAGYFEKIIILAYENDIGLLKKQVLRSLT